MALPKKSNLCVLGTYDFSVKWFHELSLLINGFDVLLFASANYNPVSSAVSLIAVSNNDWQCELE